MASWPAQTWQGGVCLTHCYPFLFLEVVLLASVIALALLTRRFVYVPVAAMVALLLILAAEVAFRVLFLGETPLAYLAQQTSRGWDSLADWAVNFAVVGGAVLFVFSIKRALIWAATGNASILPRAAVGATALLVASGAVFAAVYMFAPEVLPRRIAERAAEVAGDAPPRCGPQSAQPVAGLPVFRGFPAQEARSFARFERGGFSDVPSIYTSQMAFEHLLTRQRPIRVSNPDAYGPQRAVGLELMIGADGAVKAMAFAGGPPALFERAADIASRWRFAPFIRDGRPSDVVFRRAKVTIEGPELWQRSAAFPAFSDWDSVEIRVRQYGWEDDFELIIRGEGGVTFEGRGDRIALRGRHCAILPRESLVALVDAFRKANFFSMRDHYLSSGSSAVVSIALDDYVKEVRLSGGNRDEMPESFWHVIDAALASVHAERWTKGNAFTAPSLVAERWDFSQRDADNMLARVAASGDVETVRALLALGAPIAIAPNKSPNATFPIVESVVTALQSAANSGAFDTVRLLLAQDARWSSEALDSAYVSAIQYGDRAMMEALRVRGVSARPRGLRGKTALMAAAEAGEAGLVAEALRAGVDVNEVDDVQLTALHWAAVADHPKAAESAHADRRRVLELLLRAGASVNARTQMEWTPLIANWIGHESVAAALIANGADINAQDEDGRTALMSNANPRATEILLRAGADPNIRNREGQNALDVAKADIFADEIAVVLERWMAKHSSREAVR